MKKVMKFFAEFLAPGSFVAENWAVEVKSTDPYSVEWPENAYAFAIYAREDVVDGDNTYKGEPQQVGPTYYHPDSKVESLEEVEVNSNATQILVENMKANGWSHIVWSRWGNWPQPFDPNKARVL